MDWIEILVNIPVASVERASDICTMVVPYGFYIEDYSQLEKDALEIAHIDLIDEDLVAKPRDKAIIHIYIDPESNYKDAVDFLSHRLQAEGIDFIIDTNGISLYSAANTLLSSFTSYGATFYDTDGITKVAKFGKESQIGKSDGWHQELNAEKTSFKNGTTEYAYISPDKIYSVNAEVSDAFYIDRYSLRNGSDGKFIIGLRR